MTQVKDAIQHTADIVAAYVGNNSVSTAELPDLIRDVHSALMSASQNDGKTSEELTPAVPIRKSYNDDYIICLEDGLKFQSLKRHLRSKYNMSPDEYREKWGLAHDYPMVAPSYSRRRSELAKKSGLGQAMAEK